MITVTIQTCNMRDILGMTDLKSRNRKIPLMQVQILLPLQTKNKATMKLTITTEDSVQVLAALYEKARRIEEDTGETPRKLILAAKKIRRQVLNNLKKRKDEDKRRGKTGDKGTPRGDKAIPDGKPAAAKPGGGQADKGEQHTECET